jgi:hypothetical protein
MTHAVPAFAAFSMRIEDLVPPPEPTPVWDALVAELGDPIPHLPAPSWPGPASPEEVTADDATE